MEFYFLTKVTWTKFTREWIEIGSKTIRIVLDLIHFYHSVYTGSDPKLFAFTRGQIHLDTF